LDGSAVKDGEGLLIRTDNHDVAQSGLWICDRKGAYFGEHNVGALIHWEIGSGYADGRHRQTFNSHNMCLIERVEGGFPDGSTGSKCASLLFANQVLWVHPGNGGKNDVTEG